MFDNSIPRRSPTVYLRVVRLERVRADLVDGRGGVTETALFGRFTESYLARFGELPSRALRGS
ncbi:hypothetical protein AB0L13_41450 [Saccharopolyspora shandongensis]|uniref:hypothetical protein n=1 Tax=Saccharopolyspora shandongensis TaxID=418495 RepID=UPI00343774EA